MKLVNRVLVFKSNLYILNVDRIEFYHLLTKVHLVLVVSIASSFIYIVLIVFSNVHLNIDE